MTTSGEAARSAQRQGNRALEIGGRIGYGVNAALHVLVGLLALQLAFGGGGGQASQQGALGAVAAQPFGRTLLWLFVVGFAALFLVQLARCLGVRGQEAGSDRLQAGGLALYYAVLALAAVQYASGSGGGGGSKDLSAKILGLPGGQFLLVLIGLGVLGIGGYHVYKGVTKKFVEDLDIRDSSGRSGTAVERLGQFGYVAKGAALGLIALLVIIGAVRTDPNASSAGLDGALRSLLDEPFGPYLVAIVAIGFIAFSAYLAARARRGKV